MNRYFLVFVCVVVTLAVTSGAFAGVITYTDESAFNAALTSSQSAAYQGLTGAGTYNMLSTPLTVSGITLTNFATGSNSGQDSQLWELQGKITSGWGYPLAGQGGVAPNATNNTTLTGYSASSNAFGVEVFGNNASPYVSDQVVVTFSDSTTSTLTVTFPMFSTGGVANTPGFVGVISTTPGVTISSVLFPGTSTANSPYYSMPQYYQTPVLNKVTFGVSVPEPSTLALAVTGMIGLLCYAWRKRR